MKKKLMTERTRKTAKTSKPPGNSDITNPLSPLVKVIIGYHILLLLMSVTAI